MRTSTPLPVLPVNRDARRRLNLPDDRYDDNGRLILNSRKEAREFALLFGSTFGVSPPSAGDLYGAAHICVAWDLLLDVYAESSQPFEKTVLAALTASMDSDAVFGALASLVEDYPDAEVWHGHRSPKEDARHDSSAVLRSWTLIHMSQNDPAFRPFAELFMDPAERNQELRSGTWSEVLRADEQMDSREPEDTTPLPTLRKPIDAAPNSVKDQLLYILTRWGALLGDWAAGLLGVLDMIEEESRPRFMGPGPARGPGFDDLDGTARFSHDDDWMPRVVLLAKNVLVWLDQLSRSYGREIHRLDEIPDEELNVMASRGFNALWLIGLWERCPASREIKQRMGNPEAAASAYSLFGYDIAWELGGWPALENLRNRAAERGIRLSSDMVPNHVGIDSDWVRHHPDHLLSVSDCPFPGYSFNSDDLSGDDSVDIRLEDHYWDRSDAAVVFQRRDKRTGETRFIYHGNDGTSMPWNDTAQIDFLNPVAREAVIQDIIHVARNFPVIRFDAAMVLARKHIRRLWFPAPGAGGDIPSRSEHALSDADFNAAIPKEFWREVVDRIAVEAPGTLLLAEAFWMMEGYFVRSLGMHRVYNSAFMNMLREQKNNEYRDIIKETLAFDPGILQRFVNFMNNPDEETAVDQFGKDDRYFAACTLLATLPGLPMIGHGQIEGLSEKYGMEYVKAYREEDPDPGLIARHEREIFPLLARRCLFAGAAAFRLYDLQGEQGITESVYAFSNAFGGERALIVVNNAFDRAVGRIKWAAPVKTADDDTINDDLAGALLPENPGNDDWLLLREHIAGLWYIRSVGELRDTGLNVGIDGFGRQCYLDFRVVTETEDGVWGTLAAELAGGGVADPDAAIANIRLRPVRSALDQLLPVGSVDKMANALRKGRRPPWPENPDAAREALDFIKGFGSPAQTTPEETVREIKGRLESSAKLWRVFRRGLRRRSARRLGRPEFDEAVFLAAWSVLSPVVQRLWDDWGLSSWIETRGDALAGEKIRHLLAVAFNLPDWRSVAGRPDHVMNLLLSTIEIRKACGVNSWDGVLWYNDEAWRSMVHACILAGAGLSHRRRDLNRLVRRWTKAHRKADYRLDRLLEGLR